MADYKALITLDLDGNAAAGVQNVLNQVTSLGNVLRNLPGLAATAFGLNELADGAKKVYDAGIKMNAMLETSALGMASLYVSMGEIYDQTGRNVKGMEAFNGALQIAKETQQRLVEVSIASAGDAKEVINMYERMYAGMATAGTKSKDVQSQMVKFTATIANMAGTLQWPFETVAQQMNNMLLGIGRTQSRVGGLLKSLGVTKEMMDGWREQGILLDKLQEKLNAFWEKGPLLEKTWQATFSNMTTAFGLFSAELTKPVFDTFKSYMNNAMDAFMTRTKDGGRALNEDIAQNLRVIGITIDGIIELLVAGFTGALGIIDEAMKASGVRWVEVFAVLGSWAVDVAHSIATAFVTAGKIISDPKGSLMGALEGVKLGFYKFMADNSLTETARKSWRGLAGDVMLSSHSFTNLASSINQAMAPADALKAKAKEILETLGKGSDPSKKGAFTNILNDLKALFGDKGAEKAAKELASATKAYNDLVLRLQQKDELAGLDGIAKKFVRVRITAENELKALVEASERYSRAIGAPNGGRQDTSWMAAHFLIKEAEAKENQKVLDELLTDWDDALKKGDKVVEGHVDHIKEQLGDVATFGRDAFSSLGKAIDDGLFGVVTRGFDGLLDALRGFNEDVLRDFTGMVSNMVKRAITSQAALKQAGFAPASGDNSTWDWGRGPNNNVGVGNMSAGQWGQIGIAAVGTAGSYATGGAQSFWEGMAPYTAAAGAAAYIGNAVPGIGTVAGLIAAAAILLFGTVMNLLAPDTEDHAFIRSRDMFDSRGNPISGSGTQVLETASNISTTVMDLFRLTGQSGGADFAKSLNKIVMDYIQTIDFEAHAGSSEDLQNDIKRVFTTEIPRNLLNLMFGKRLGPQDLPGISGGTKGEGFFDTNAPIPMMLKGLGFTVAAIQNISEQIDLRGPDKFLEYFKSLVGVVVSIRNLRADMSRSGSDVMGDQAREENKSPIQRFREGVTSLKEGFAGLSLYTGDAFLNKAKELVEASRQYYQEALDFINNVRGMIKSIIASTNAQVATMSQAFETDAEKKARLDKTIHYAKRDLWSEDPNKVADAVKVIQDAVNELFQGLMALYNNAKAALAEVNDTRKLYREGNYYGDTPKSASDFAWRASKLWDKVAQASMLAGQEQIDAIRAVNTEARSLWDAMSNMLREIVSNVDALGKSIWQQKFGMLMDASEPGEQVNLIMGRVRDLQGKLRNAGSASEVKEITDEIQDLMRQYWGLIKDDPAAKEAGRNLINKILDDTQALAEYVYGELHSSIVDSMEPIKQALELAAGVLTSTMIGVESEVAKLRDIIIGVQQIATQSLTSIVNRVADEMATLDVELGKLNTSLTTLNTTVGGGNPPDPDRDPAHNPHGPDSLIGAYERSKGMVDAFTEALGNAVLALGGELPPPTQFAPANTINAIRHDPTLTGRVTGGFA